MVKYTFQYIPIIDVLQAMLKDDIILEEVILDLVILYTKQGRRNRSGRPGNCRTNISSFQTVIMIQSISTLKDRIFSYLRFAMHARMQVPSLLLTTEKCLAIVVLIVNQAF